MSTHDHGRPKITYLQHLSRVRQHLRADESLHLLCTALSAACFAALAYTLLLQHPQILAVTLAQMLPDALAAATAVAATLVALAQAFRGQSQLRRVVWRCELAEDKEALVHEHPEREALLADEDLMRLCHKASLLSRTYPSTDRNMAGFLEAYRQLLLHYPLLVSLGERQRYVDRMIRQADKGLRPDETPSPDR